MHDAPNEITHALISDIGNANLLAEVEDLARTIATTRRELNRLDVGPFIVDHIPAATDELDAVVAHTASATNTILEACEQLENAAAEGQAIDAELVGRCTTSIYEACSFQDITGQRIKKVVSTLQAVEQKVSDILKVFGQGGEIDIAPTDMASLTNGPQLPDKAMHQSDIDAMLADF